MNLEYGGMHMENSNEIKQDNINTKAKIISNTPKAYIDDYKEYCNILHDKLIEKEVKNIGIVSSYGAGKSSLIATYKELYSNDDKKWMSISLANFNKGKNNGSEKKNETEIETVAKNTHLEDVHSNVEKSILQQILFSVPAKKVPFSKINRIATKGWGTIGCAALIVLFFASIYLLANSFGKSPIFEQENANVILLGLSIILGVALVSLILWKFKIKNIGADKFSTEFYEEKDFTLNKFIDEILYFFEKSKVENVVFEDLDRFEDLSIFSKLRELNQLINNYGAIDRKIAFIYAVKDDMFDNEEEKAKFFDFTLPLVPALNPNNVKEMIKKYLKENCNQSMNISNSYINGVAWQIKDMRILINIMNDYIIFYTIVNKANDNLFIAKSKDNNKVSKIASNEKLFSLMIYKNIKPKDFAKLQKREGDVWRVFDVKQNMCTIRIKELENKIDNLKDSILDSDKEYLSNFNQLKYMFSGMCVENEDSHNNCIQLKAITTFKSIDENQAIEAPFYSCTMKHANEKLSDGETFWSKEQNILNKNRNRKHEIESETSRIQLQIRKLSNLSTKRFIEQYGYQEMIGEDDELMLFLISQGYIAEDCLDYVTIADESILSSNDKEFIRNVRLQKDNNADLILKNLKEITANLAVESLSSVSILNYDFIKYYSKFSADEKLAIIDLLSEDESKVNFFIANFFVKYRVDELLSDLMDRRHDVFKLFLSEISNEKIEYLLSNIFIGLDVENILKASSGGNIGRLINKQNCMKLFCGVENASDMLDSLNIKLKDISCDNKNEVFYNSIIKKDLYEINLKNMQHILNTDLVTISKVYNSKDDSVIKYVEENKESFINDVIIIQGKLIGEKQTILNEFIVDMNFEWIDVDLWVDLFDFKVKVSSDVNNMFLKELVEYRKLELSFENLKTAYYSGLEIADFSKLIHENYLKIGYTNMANDNNFEFLKLLLEVVCNNSEILEFIVKKVKKNRFDVLETPNDEILTCLILHQKIKYDLSNLNGLTGKINLLNMFVSKNPEKFIQSIKECNLTVTDYKGIFDDRTISNKIKFEIWKAGVSIGIDTGNYDIVLQIKNQYKIVLNTEEVIGLFEFLNSSQKKQYIVDHGDTTEAAALRYVLLRIDEDISKIISGETTKKKKSNFDKRIVDILVKCELIACRETSDYFNFIKV